MTRRGRSRHPAGAIHGRGGQFSPANRPDDVTADALNISDRSESTDSLRLSWKGFPVALHRVGNRWAPQTDTLNARAFTTTSIGLGVQLAAEDSAEARREAVNRALVPHVHSGVFADLLNENEVSLDDLLELLKAPGTECLGVPGDDSHHCRSLMSQMVSLRVLEEAERALDGSPLRYVPADLSNLRAPHGADPAALVGDIKSIIPERWNTPGKLWGGVALKAHGFMRLAGGTTDPFTIAERTPVGSRIGDETLLARLYDRCRAMGATGREQEAFAGDIAQDHHLAWLLLAKSTQVKNDRAAFGRWLRRRPRLSPDKDACRQLIQEATKPSQSPRAVATNRLAADVFAAVWQLADQMPRRRLVLEGAVYSHCLLQARTKQRGLRATLERAFAGHPDRLEDLLRLHAAAVSTATTRPRPVVLQGGSS